MGIFGGIAAGVREGTWWLHSKSDPRWNAEGQSVVGGLEMPDECRQKMEELKKTLGNPPRDLEFGYMKD